MALGLNGPILNLDVFYLYCIWTVIFRERLGIIESQLQYAALEPEAGARGVGLWRPGELLIR